jgi:hypothetical protein
LEKTGLCFSFVVLLAKAYSSFTSGNAEETNALLYGNIAALSVAAIVRLFDLDSVGELIDTYIRDRLDS